MWAQYVRYNIKKGCPVLKNQRLQIEASTDISESTMRICYLLLPLCAALLCPLLGNAAPLPTNSIDDSTNNVTTDSPYDNLPLEQGVGVNDVPHTDYTPFNNSNNSLENILAEVLDRLQQQKGKW